VRFDERDAKTTRAHSREERRARKKVSRAASIGGGHSVLLEESPTPARGREVENA